MLPSTRSSLLAACVAALLLVSGLGVAGSTVAVDNETANATQPQAPGDLDLPERVVPPGTQTTGTETVGANPSAAIDRSGGRLDGAYQRHLLEARLEAAEDDEARRTVVRSTVSSINQSIERLRTRERTASQNYRDGTTSKAAYLAEIGSISAEAEQLERLADHVDPVDPQSDGLAAEYSVTEATGELGQIRGDIRALHGPVRSQIGESIAAERSPSRVHVVSTPNGTVLSTIEDGSYHREAIRTDVLTGGSERGIGHSEAFELTESELYPVYMSNYDLTTLGRGIPGQMYLVLGEGPVSYEHGVLRGYIDAVSRNVFWEYQRMTLDDDLPTTSPVTNSNRDLSITVRATYGTGPASVSVTQGNTPVSDVTVSVAGEAAATTDESGEAWVVLPNDTSTVSVTSDGNTAEVTVDWETAYGSTNETAS